MSFEIDVPAYPTETINGAERGITIRQLGTLMALQGLLAASADKNIDPTTIAKLAHDCAYAALKVAN